MQKKRNKTNTNTKTKASRKKTISGTFAIAAGVAAITGAAVMSTTPSTHAETQTTMSVTEADAGAVNDAEKKEAKTLALQNATPQRQHHQRKILMMKNISHI